MPKKGFLSGNALKLLGSVFMLIDHAGLLLFPSLPWLRIVGRLAFPIFAFMIAEGCLYTRNRRKHFLVIFALGVLMQVVLYIATRMTSFSIFIIFSFSILLIYLLDATTDAMDAAIRRHPAQKARKAQEDVPGFPAQETAQSQEVRDADRENREENAGKIGAKRERPYDLLVAFWALLFIGLTTVLYVWCDQTTYFEANYGFFGILTPVAVYAARKYGGDYSFFFAFLALALCNLVITQSSQFAIQHYALLAIPLLLCYNGEKGRYHLKYFFYLFYPLHIVVLEGIALLFFH